MFSKCIIWHYIVKYFHSAFIATDVRICLSGLSLQGVTGCDIKDAEGELVNESHHKEMLSGF